MPTRTVQTLNRVAKVSAMSWDLSPSSATKMTPNARSVLVRTASTGRYGPLWSDRGEMGRPRPGTCCLGRRSRPPGGPGRTAGRPPADRHRSVCRPRHWGLLPFAADETTGRRPAAHRDGRLVANASAGAGLAGFDGRELRPGQGHGPAPV